MSFKLSTRARYALRMMLDIARNGGESEPVSLSGVSERTRVSRGYLEQLAIVLRNHNLLRGVLGKQGGYRLARPAQEITLREVVEASIGPIAILDCVLEPDHCAQSEACECRFLYLLINHRVVQVFEDYSLADLIRPGWAATVKRALEEGDTLVLPKVAEGKTG
ncbi:MAG: RrF2 family transcriptional regulator [Acidobacteriota bacterium]